MKKNRMNVKVSIMLAEYNCVKAEIKTFFEIEFKILGIWITFMGVLIGFVLSQYSNIIGSNPSSHVYEFSSFIITTLLLVIIPGVCDLFGLLWLDFTTRIIKQANYLYKIENKMNDLVSDNKEQLLYFEHYIIKDSTKRGRGYLSNYYYYYFLLGSFFILPPIFCLCGICKMIDKPECIYFIIFIVLEFFTWSFVKTYVLKILSYKRISKKTFF